MNEFSCVYKRTIFRNTKTGYTVFAVDTKEKTEHRDRNGFVVCIGTIPTYSQGMPLKVSGEWTIKNTRNYFKIDKITEYSDEKNTTIDFITNSGIKGVSSKTASNIVDVFGTDIFSLIDKDNAVQLLTSKITRLSEERATTLVRKLKLDRLKREAYEYLVKFGGDYSSAIKIVENFQETWKIKLIENPYYIGSKYGLSFYVSDSIAKDNGVDYINKNRINAIIFESLVSSLNSGHSYLTLKELHNKIKYIVKQSAFCEDIPLEMIVYALLNCKFIVIEEDAPHRIYLKKIWEYEANSALEFLRIKKSAYTLPYRNDIVDEIESKCKIRYAKSQRDAFQILKSSGLKIITGGPGTGKTTTLNGIIQAYHMLNPDKKVILCAPTGRAAQRMSESTGLPAVTIHKLLDFQYIGDDLSHKDKYDPIDADFIIVDESSMLDIQLFYILLSAIKNGSLVCFLGDVNQLPSVGSGNVLMDLINSKKAETYRLDTVFRQGETSGIIRNCTNILKGNYNLEETKDFHIINVSSHEDTNKELLKLARKFYDKDDIYSLQILGPKLKGDNGVENINRLFQDEFFSCASSISYGYHSFHVQDKIILTKNNYEIGYYNGNIGEIKELYTDYMIVDINGIEFKIPEKCYEDIKLAYSITIHKSQGSEFSRCIIILPDDAGSILTKNLVFTAISRAKNEVYIINENNALAYALNNDKTFKRNTTLKDKILELPYKILDPM